MLCSRPGHVSQYAYCPVRFERAIPISNRYTFAVGVCGVAAEKTGSAMEKYNAASRLATRLVQVWQHETGRADPHLAAILASGPDAGARLRELVVSDQYAKEESQLLLRRLEHFAAENEEILPEAGDCLNGGDMPRFGYWVARSQRAAEGLLGNQIPETSHLASSAQALGAIAASAFGAGFGGSVWALVERDRVGAFLVSWAEAYRAEFPERAAAATFFQTSAGPAAQQIA
jgi:galactokinase